MNYSLVTAIIVSAAFMASCSDDTPTNKNNNQHSTTSSLFVDETAHLIVLTPYESSENICELQQDETLVWKTITRESEPDSFKYDFIGDTLVLYEIYHGETDSYGSMFVGGSAGNIYGTWVYSNCDFYSPSNETECDSDTPIRTETYKITSEKFTAIFEYHYDIYFGDSKTKDYMKSTFMADLYNFLTNENDLENISYIVLNNSDDSSKVAQSIEQNNVQILKSTKTSQTFKISDITYTATIKKAEVTLNNVNPKPNVDVIVDVTDGSTTCNGYATYKTIDKNICKTENLPYLKIREKDDDNGKTLLYADTYTKTNYKAFLKCLNSIALPTKNKQPRTIAYAKESTYKANREKRADKRFLKMLKYIEK